jgi:hypothetical protein
MLHPVLIVILLPVVLPLLLLQWGIGRVLRNLCSPVTNAICNRSGCHQWIQEFEGSAETSNTKTFIMVLSYVFILVTSLKIAKHMDVDDTELLVGFLAVVVAITIVICKRINYVCDHGCSSGVLNVPDSTQDEENQGLLVATESDDDDQL